MSDASWKPDPTGRHEHRYWDGAAWTSHVGDAGVRGEDPPDGLPSAAPSADANVAATDRASDPAVKAIDKVLDAKLRNKLLVRKEIRRLPDLLEPGEELITAASGTYEDRNGLLAVTNRRILFVDDGMMRKRVEEFHYGRVSSIQWKTAMLSAAITVVTSGNRATIKNVIPKERAQEIAAYVSKRISGDIQREPSAPATSAAPTASAESASPLEQIRQLAELRDMGAVSPEEFEAKKTELLRRL